MSLEIYRDPRRPKLAFREFSASRPTHLPLPPPASGLKPSLLLLHGVGRYSADYECLAAGLVDKWRVLALDFRGHGDSDRLGPQASLPACKRDLGANAELKASDPGSYRVIDFATDLIEWVRARAGEPLVVYGHSLGAMVALAVAVECPEWVRGALLEDPPFHTMGRNIGQTPWRALFAGLHSVARCGGDRETLARGVGEIEIPSALGSSPTKLRDFRSRDSLEFTAQCLAKVDPEVYTSIIGGSWLDGYDERALFGRVRVPLWLLQGDAAAGAALTDADAESALKASPSIRRIRFPGVGHLIHQEQPEAILRIIAEFAATLRSRNSDYLG